MNEQKPTPAVDTGMSGNLLVHSIFHTIQGEGPFAGQRAIFIRLAGCNLQCPLCDTEYTAGAQPRTIKSIVAQCERFHERTGTSLIVLTGGEPLRQNLTGLLNTLYWRNQFTVQIETNGSIAGPSEPCALQRHTVVVSPKLSRVEPFIGHIASAWKYVITAGEVDEQDGLPIHVLGLKGKRSVARPFGPNSGKVYVQPADSHDEEADKANMAAAVASCMDHGYTLCLQMHKYAGVE